MHEVFDKLIRVQATFWKNLQKAMTLLSVLVEGITYNF